MREVPELPHLEGTEDNRTLNLILNSLLVSSADDFTDRGHVTSLVRLSDKAVGAYTTAQALFKLWRESPTGHFSPFFRGISSLEDCINSAHRALLHADRLAVGFPDLSKTIPAGAARTNLRAVRNRIEHMDEDLADGVLTENDQLSWTLKPHIDRVEIGHESLTFEELSECVCGVDAAAGWATANNWTEPPED